MKRFLLLLPLLLSFLILPAAPTVAHAEESSEYAVAAGREVWFYSEPNDESKLFTLPFTYYVHITNEGEEYCAVEYLEDVGPYRKIEGYCKKSELTFVNFPPERPYLHLEITLTYEIKGASSIFDSGSLRTREISAVYYGSRTEQGELFHYVYAEGEFNYVPATTVPTYELNTDYLEVGEPTPSVAGREGGLSAGHIVAIVIVCLVAIIVTVLLLRGKVGSRTEETTEF